MIALLRGAKPQKDTKVFSPFSYYTTISINVNKYFWVSFVEISHILGLGIKNNKKIGGEIGEFDEKTKVTW